MALPNQRAGADGVDLQAIDAVFRYHRNLGLARAFSSGLSA
jgi:hypothetical protein